MEFKTDFQTWILFIQDPFCYLWSGHRNRFRGIFWIEVDARERVTSCLRPQPLSWYTLRCSHRLNLRGLESHLLNHNHGRWACKWSERRPLSTLKLRIDVDVWWRRESHQVSWWKRVVFILLLKASHSSPLGWCKRPHRRIQHAIVHSIALYAIWSELNLILYAVLYEIHTLDTHWKIANKGFRLTCGWSFCWRRPQILHSGNLLTFIGTAPFHPPLRTSNFWSTITTLTLPPQTTTWTLA